MDHSYVNRYNRNSIDYTKDTIFVTTPENEEVALKRVHVEGRIYTQGPKRDFKISFEIYSRSRVISKNFESTQQTKLWMDSRGGCYELIESSRLKSHNKLEQIQCLVSSLTDWTHIIKPTSIPQKIISADSSKPMTYGLLIPADSVPLDDEAQIQLINRTSIRTILLFLFSSLKAVNEYHETGYLLGGLSAKNIRIKSESIGFNISILKYLNVIAIEDVVSVRISQNKKCTLKDNLPLWAEGDEYIEMNLEQAKGWDLYCITNLLNRSLCSYILSRIKNQSKNKYLKNAVKLKNKLTLKIIQIKNSKSIEESGLSEFTYEMLGNLLEEHGVLI